MIFDDKTILLTILITYLLLSSTIGSYVLCLKDRTIKKITLFEIVGSILPAIAFSWFMAFFWISNKIVFKNKN